MSKKEREKKKFGFQKKAWCVQDYCVNNTRTESVKEILTLFLYLEGILSLIFLFWVNHLVDVLHFLDFGTLEDLFEFGVLSFENFKNSVGIRMPTFGGSIF